MFFVFQLIGDPSQPGASLFRANIQKVVTILEQAEDIPIASKGLNILRTLAPLYSSDFSLLTKGEKDKQKADVMAVVRTLAFPYHDSKPRRPFSETSSVVSSLKSPSYSASSESPATGFMQIQTPVSSMRDSVSDPQHARSLSGYTDTTSHRPDDISRLVSTPGLTSPDYSNLVPLAQSNPELRPTTALTYSGPQEQQTNSQTSGNGGIQVQDLVWGASLGFGAGEWSSFLEMMQPSLN